ncbi:hypothetical protein A1353_10445 [Methylomonas methanica]|uniref:DUF4160 domain-containing protein n=1 Tax=Methylomonas methanica TaxID=421 RepID=A0A177MJZ6_METMH|nr:DUF4160 domain-containing protein [Methylomonas methanica]OAI06127.1 hypothetical protein A1353_10445 [Methylomonas methanica]
MPTLLNLNGFKFFFYANEHEPMHIHVSKGDEFAKIELVTLRVTRNTLKPKDLKQALDTTENHQQEFMEAWRDYFDNR